VNDNDRDHPDTTTGPARLRDDDTPGRRFGERRPPLCNNPIVQCAKACELFDLTPQSRVRQCLRMNAKTRRSVGNKYPVGHLSPYRGIQSGQLGKITMSSWFISPWEAARLSLEAQRQVALLFFPYASRKEQQPLEQGRQPLEVASDAQSHVVTHQDIGSAHIPRSRRRTAQAKTVTAHKATQVMRNGTGSRKIKSRNRRRKSDKQRS
jgi:hypothetical protein